MEATRRKKQFYCDSVNLKRKMNRELVSEPTVGKFILHHETSEKWDKADFNIATFIRQHGCHRMEKLKIE